MLTVGKLVKIKEYEDLQETINKERLNKTIDIFKDAENEEEWKQKKEEIKRSKEIELKKREVYFKNKENTHYISETEDNKIKEIQQKVLENRQRLQKMYDERISRQHKI